MKQNIENTIKTSVFISLKYEYTITGFFANQKREIYRGVYMSSVKKTNGSKREFPALYEKLIPILLGMLAFGVVLMLLFAFLVASGII